MGTVATALLFGVAPGVAGQAAKITLTSIPQAAAQAQFDAGVRAMNEFADLQAREIFAKLVAASPPVAIAAKAYLYMGIIDFNGLDTSLALQEFRHAVEIDPAVEPPLTMSPKAKMVFAEARRAISAELAQQYAPTPAAKAPAAVAPPSDQTPAAPVEAEAESPAPAKGSSHALSWTFGSVGVALGAVAVVGLVQILDSNSIVGQANASKNALSSAKVAPALANAQSWQPWTIGLAIGGAALFTTAFFVW